MVTTDQSLEYQQNLQGRRLALVVLSKNHIDLLEKHPDKLILALDSATPGSMSWSGTNCRRNQA